MADWDTLQTPVKERESHVKSLAEELKKALDEAKDASVKESALVPGQLPDHVTLLNRCAFVAFISVFLNFNIFQAAFVYSSNLLHIFFVSAWGVRC